MLLGGGGSPQVSSCSTSVMAWPIIFLNLPSQNAETLAAVIKKAIKAKKAEVVSPLVSSLGEFYQNSW